MRMKKLFEGAILGAVIGAAFSLIGASLVSTDNYRIMFLMTFIEVGLIIGLLWSAKVEDRNEQKEASQAGKSQN